MKKVIVTGGAGYIGSHTVVALHEAGYFPVVVDNFSNSERSVMAGLKKITGQDFPIHETDCTDLHALRSVFLKEGSIDGIIHFAAYKAVGESVQFPHKYYHNNLNSTNNLLFLMKEFKISNLIFSSSCTVYGEPSVIPVDENSPIIPATSPYGHTKQVCEDMIRQFQPSHQQQSAIILRYFNPIGAHPSAAIGELPLGVPNNLIPFITQTAAGIRPQLTIFGDDYDTEDGTCIRDYIHVMDLARAHVKSLDLAIQMQGGMEVINLGTGKGHSVKTVVDTFEAVTGVKVPHRIGPRREGDVSKIYSVSDKANRLLNWKCEYDLSDMVKHAWAWQEELGRRGKG